MTTDEPLTNRDRNREAEKKRMPKHGARLAQVYKNAILKRANRPSKKKKPR
ncbi:MAG TPA: hypothetical protein VMW65_02500 [Chloroflexota bacterium]|nr:hypothetical protein [Chloroflexota bacterium]